MAPLEVLPHPFERPMTRAKVAEFATIANLGGRGVDFLRAFPASCDGRLRISAHHKDA